MPSSSRWPGWIRLGKVHSSITKKLVYSRDLCQVIQLCMVSPSARIQLSTQVVPQSLLINKLINKETSIPTHQILHLCDTLLFFELLQKIVFRCLSDCPILRRKTWKLPYFYTLTWVSWRVPKHSEILEYVCTIVFRCFLSQFVSQQHGRWASHKRLGMIPEKIFLADCSCSQAK
jgi:hypothetical protein